MNTITSPQERFHQRFYRTIHFRQIETTSIQPEEETSDEKEDVAKIEATEITPEPDKIEASQDTQIELEEIEETPEVSTEAESVADKPDLELETVTEPEPESGKSNEKVEIDKKMEISSTNLVDLSDSITDMTASMIKVRINTEEEAKAALAERRRLAREEAERQAEMERRRIEEEQRLELERQQREEEQQRILIEKLRAEEQQRLEEVNILKHSL